MFGYDAGEFGGLPRNEFVDLLIAEGIPAFVAYAPIHKTPVFRDGIFCPRWRGNEALLPNYREVSCPVAEAIGNEVVWLHHRVLLGTQDQITEMAERIRRIQQLHVKKADYASTSKGV